MRQQIGVAGRALPGQALVGVGPGVLLVRALGVAGGRARQQGLLVRRVVEAPDGSAATGAARVEADDVEAPAHLFGELPEHHGQGRGAGRGRAAGVVEQ
ncbi:hypothetical protein PUR71_07370 [Streptomyces sp. SP17BM10]|nr:hypothetical protein [Streptomyces sp. SP17BM10]MEE1782739.1 hypothetical protein [Streptomyces sp. SP17BM10]